MPSCEWCRCQEYEQERLYREWARTPCAKRPRCPLPDPNQNRCSCAPIYICAPTKPNPLPIKPDEDLFPVVGLPDEIGENPLFPGDPIPDNEEEPVEGPRLPIVPPFCTSEWKLIAKEGESVSFAEQVDVKFGVNPTFFVKYNVTGVIPFTTTFFGNPQPGVKTGWFKCASRPPIVPPPPPPPPPPPVGGYSYGGGGYSRTPYTPAERMKASLQKALISNKRQDPDGTSWLTPANYEAAKWDGKPFDLTGKTNSPSDRKEICDFLAPPGSSQTIRGLRERFYEVNPFADVTNPTLAEIDDWNLEVIRHIRKLFGITLPIDHDARLYLEANWASERKYTTVWDADYPGPIDGNAAGPCKMGDFRLAVEHCGDGFIPSVAAHRAPYIAAPPYNNDLVKYPQLSPSVYPGPKSEGNPLGRFSKASGISQIEDTHPWSIKLAQIFKRWICAEGPMGHAGPFLGRRYVGMSWWHEPGQVADQIGFRGKWA